MIFYNIIKKLALPPGSIILLLLICIALWHYNRRIAFALLLLATLLLWLFSTPIVAVYLAKPLEKDTPITKAVDLQQHNVGAIVVLSGGVYANAPEFGGADSIRSSTLQRMYYAAYLYEQTHLPVLLSGGIPDEPRTPIADTMATAATQVFMIPNTKVWVENKSKNTEENAKYCARLLKQKNIEKVYLVTDAVHMLRAKNAFTKYGIKTIPAPTTFYTIEYKPTSILAWLPNGDAINRSYSCVYEYIGNVWYKIAH